MTTPYPPGPQQPGPYAQAPARQAQVPQDGHDAYLRGAPVSWGQAISLAFRNAFNYKGRASRSAYWWMALFDALCFAGTYAVLILVTLGLRNAALGRVFGILMILVAIGIFVVTLPLAVRRLHDSDRSGFWLFIDLVPFGGIVLLVFFLMSGTPGPNRFG